MYTYCYRNCSTKYICQLWQPEIKGQSHNYSWFFFSDEMFTLCINYIGYTYLCINYIGYTYARVGIEVLLTQQRCCANFQVQIVVFSYTCLCAIILTLWILHYKTSTVFCFIFPGCCNIILVFETLATNMKMRALKNAFQKPRL